MKEKIFSPLEPSGGRWGVPQLKVGRTAGRIRGNYLRREVNIIETWSIVHELEVLNAFLDLFWIVEWRERVGLVFWRKGR